MAGCEQTFQYRVIKDGRVEAICEGSALEDNTAIKSNSKYDTDFNIFRFVMAAERQHRKEKEIIEAAANALNNHLRIRKALGLDNQPVRSFDDNPLFQKKLMPKGEILDVHDSKNRLLWYIEYATIAVESIANVLQSSLVCKYQFWQFEYMLRRVMEQERKTGRLSSIRHIIDMTGYEINPFTMVFVTNGTLAYYSQLFHYENYPELVTPIEIVNIAKWIHLPYKIAKAMMPAGFSDKFRLHDSNFLEALIEDIDLECIPTTLGGKNESIACLGASKPSQSEHWTADEEVLNHLESFHIPARHHRHIAIEIHEPNTLSWYFRTDGDIFFGVFFEETCASKKDKELDLNSMEMVYPWLKLSAKLVHENDSITCERIGRYHIVFCNKHSWLSRRKIDICMQVTDVNGNSKQLHSNGLLSHAPAQVKHLVRQND
ncbi:hypothetical protein Y032_0437g1453 [Ancylostoma ceylanicum]|uniref:CRAL-TRIO domain-containing protein n=1 Tax=Ancylostoma ceylanicum TaxID=53326 RepID=A0A016X1L4_9BILA|nr:hypothetical protein Y032_0437g1453 [Ancylostoma ceylanicum]